MLHPLLTDKLLFAYVRALGLAIRKTDAHEYRITIRCVPNTVRTRDRAESIAYYTTDRGDAAATARAMARQLAAMTIAHVDACIATENAAAAIPSLDADAPPPVDAFVTLSARRLD